MSEKFVINGLKHRENIVHQEQLRPDHFAKISAWQRQSHALNAEKYRITLKARAENDSKGRKLYDQNYGNEVKKRARDAAGVVEKFWTADEVTAEIFRLRAKNAHGYDIYITPIDSTKHFIVVDDMTPEREKALINAGVRPAIIQRSSDNNKQAIIIINREPGKDEQKLANQLVVKLNKEFGDEKFSGVIHPFRLAGFSNKKAGKSNYLTIIETAIRRMCVVSSAAMNIIRDADRLKIELYKMKAVDKARSLRLSKIDDDGQITDNPVELAYRREVKKIVGLARKMGWTLDWSRVDFAVTKSLLKMGYRADVIEKAMILESPKIASRHRDTAKYAAETVNNARADAQVIRVLNERAQQFDKELS